MKDDLALKVEVSETDERVTKRFGLRVEICKYIEEYITKGDLEHSENDSADGLVLAKLIFNNKGVQAVVFEGYEIYVTIGSAFDWTSDDLQKKVLAVITQYLKAQRLMDGASQKQEGE